tara:strand:- start:1146 stop:1760 length:615 start_codon:yes stop_codon:yes gene_type:complete
MLNNSFGEYIDVFTFNKTRKKTLILIHGLFSNAGFWLTFIKNFKEFKLIIFNINYPKLLLENLEEINFNDFVKSLLKDEKDIFIISHSMGTVLAKYFPNKKLKISFEICPTYNSLRKNKIQFLNEVNSLFDNKNDEAKNILKNASFFIKRNYTKKKGDIKTKKYIPINDIYFDNSLIKNADYFIGDHFDINNSIQMIYEYINNK